MNNIQLNPRNYNRQQKDHTINRNILISGYGAYQMCPFPKESFRIAYRKDFNRIPKQNRLICNVLVMHQHALDVVGNLSTRGLSELKSKNPYPVIINPMYRDFTGKNSRSDSAMPDENLILRTNYSFIVQRQDNLFPISSDSEVVYTAPVTVLRDPAYNEIPHENLYRTGVITVTPNPPTLIDDVVRDGDKYQTYKILSTRDFVKLQLQLEAAFQVAAMGGHNSVVVSIFDKEFGIPIDEQIKVFNLCIMKYGQFFKAIIFAIPPYQPVGIAEDLDISLAKPQKIANDEEMKAKADILNNTFGHDNDNDDDESEAESEEKCSPSNMTDSEKRAYLKKKIREKRKNDEKIAKKHKHKHSKD